MTICIFRLFNFVFIVYILMGLLLNSVSLAAAYAHIELLAGVVIENIIRPFSRS